MCIVKTNVIKECCICFSENEIFNQSVVDSEPLSVNNIKKEYFDNNVIPEDLLLKSSCNEHYVCVKCLRRVVTNYESHPINEHNSDLFCPYPFSECVNEIGFRYIIEHKSIKEILNDNEYTEFINYTNKYRFPGFEVVRCVGKKIDYITHSFKECNAEILVPIDEIKETAKGELIITCDQNQDCLKSFCYHCKDIAYLTKKCESCLYVNENQNPECYNRYFNLSTENTNDNIRVTDDEDTFDSSQLEFPADYLIKNKDITCDMALDTLMDIISNPYSYMMCCICKTPMFKTEKCNALSHHKIERCYACGRIGEKYIGLGDHWSSTGVGGCPRFMYDTYIVYRLKKFMCRENECFNHDMGECNDPTHEEGVKQYNDERIKSIVLHSLNSLLPELRYLVYDALFSKTENTDSFMYIPYKQTLKLLEKYPKRSTDYTEEIIYEQLGLKQPIDCVGNDKTLIIDDIQAEPKTEISYFSAYSYNTFGLSAWRQNFERQRALILPQLDEQDTQDHENETDLTEMRILNQTLTRDLSQLAQSASELHNTNTTEIDRQLDELNDYVSEIDELTVQLAELGSLGMRSNNTNVFQEETPQIQIRNPISAFPFPYAEIIQGYINEFDDGSDDSSEIQPLLYDTHDTQEHDSSSITTTNTAPSQNSENTSQNTENNNITVTLDDDLIEIIILD